MALTNIKKIMLVNKEIKLFHLRELLTSLNISSDRTEKLGNWIRMIYYIVFSETKKKMSCCNENIQLCR